MSGYLPTTKILHRTSETNTDISNAALKPTDTTNADTNPAVDIDQVGNTDVVRKENTKVFDSTGIVSPQEYATS